MTLRDARRVRAARPGDIVFTGTPEGVIQGKPKDQRVWLKAGDEVACSLEKLGELKFTLTRRPPRGREQPEEGDRSRRRAG